MTPSKSINNDSDRFAHFVFRSFRTMCHMSMHAIPPLHSVPLQTLHARSNHLSLTEDLHFEPSGSPPGSCPTHNPPSVLAAPTQGIRWVMNPRYEYELPAGLGLGQFSEVSHSMTSGSEAAGSTPAPSLPTCAGADRAPGRPPAAAAAEAGDAACSGRPARATEGGESSGFQAAAAGEVQSVYGGSGRFTADGTVESDTESMQSEGGMGDAVRAAPGTPDLRTEGSSEDLQEAVTRSMYAECCTDSEF